jgi:hypothetical protein
LAWKVRRERREEGGGTGVEGGMREGRGRDEGEMREG